MFRRNGPVIKSVQSVLKPEEILFVEFVENVYTYRSSAGSEKVRKIWVVRVVSRHSEEM